MKSLLYGIAAIAVAVAGVGNVNAAVVNGSFEAPSIGPNAYALYETIPGWYSPSNSLIEIQSNSILGPNNVAQDGVQYVELNPFFPGTLAQNITTVIGQQYELSFWYSARPGYGDASANVLFTGSAPGLFSDLEPPVVTWKHYTSIVTATSTSSTLEFDALTPSGGGGMLLDNVSLTAVPEPATMSLLAAGAIGLVGARLRKRKLASAVA